MSDFDYDDIEMACDLVKRDVQAFLHGELPETSADRLRHHLMVCERCMDNFSAEEYITELIRRAWSAPAAPRSLRMKITRMHVRWEG